MKGSDDSDQKDIIDQKLQTQIFDIMDEMFQVIELIYDDNGKAIDYIHLQVNPAFEKLVQMKKEDLIGKRVKDIFGIIEDYWIEIYERVESTGVTENFENYGAELDKYYAIKAWKIGENKVAVLFTEITEKYKMEYALKESEERIRLFTQNVPDYLLQIDRMGKIEYINKTFEGLTQKDVIGTSVYSWIPDESLQKFKDKVEKVFINGCNEIIEYPSEGAKGEPVWFESQIGPLENSGIINHVIIVARDITEKKNAVEASLNSDKRFKIVAESAGKWVWEINAEGLYTYSSPLVKQILGYTPEEIVGKKHFFDFFQKDVKEQLKEEAINAFKQKLIIKDFESPKEHKNGEIVILNTSGSPILDKDGNLIGYLGADSDITERKIAENEIRYQASLIEQMDTAIITIGFDNKILSWNEHAKSLYGWSKEEVIGKDIIELLGAEESKEETLKSFVDLNRDGHWEGDYLANKKDGTRVPIHVINSYLKDSNGENIGFIGLSTDITYRIKAEIKLNQSTQLLETSQAIAKLGGWELDIVTNNLFWTAETYRIYDTSTEEFNPTVDAGFGYFLPESRRIISDALKAAVENAKGYDLILETLTTKGRRIDIRTTCEVILLDGKPIRLTGIFQDITELKQVENKILAAEETARLNEQYYKNIINKMGDPVFVKDNQSRLLLVNDAFCKIFDLPRDSIIGKTLAEDVPPNEREHFLRVDKQVIQDGKDNISEESLTVRNGKTRTISTRKSRFTDNSGKNFLVGVIRDITEIQKSEEALRESEENLSTILNYIGEAVIATDGEGKITQMNPVAQKLTGWALKDAKTTLLPNVLKITNAISGETIPNPVEGMITSGTIYKLTNNTILTSRDGVKRQIAARGAPIKNSTGEIVGVVLVFRDVTEQYKLEEQFRQSQKMDAIGQLAGGVAHDFNNMLTGIMGCAEIISSKVAEDEALSQLSNLILDTSMQAAELTKKLLSFSHKAKSVNEIFDIHESITKTLSMLKRSINRSIIIKSNLDAPNSYINGDQSLIQNSLLNLGLNARDVMPKGGTLTFTTRNVIFEQKDINSNSDIAPGNYIEIEVEDTGCGMTQEVQSRLFEPFFTTKPMGKGTGLGLSTVYNTIKGNDGNISISSEINRGSIFKILLPIILDINESKDIVAKKTVPGIGTILVVDDENIVRLVLGQMLSELGYNVLFAEEGEECIKIYKEKGNSIDMIILDMVMPKMNGRDVFYALKEINPDIKVLICSGFSKDINIEKLIEDGVSAFMQKPYKKIDISMKIKEILS
ncbi:MAG: PAS domain S-box protein [Spirochaetaceae bacterium]